MAKSLGMSGLGIGINSGGSNTSNAYQNRLAQYQQYSPVERVAPEYTSTGLTKNQSEAFVNTALSSQPLPSSANMYESHYQLVRDKANVLFSDEVLEHYARDKRSMIEWGNKVDQLNQEIATYEAAYQDSFGDPSRATGEGTTWADYTRRRQMAGGQDGYFSQAGVKADRTDDDFLNVMKVIDSRQHTNMRFNFETGEFEYDRLYRDGEAPAIDPFSINNPQAATSLFSFNLTQAAFESPSDYASKDKYYRVADSPEQFAQRMDQELSKDTFKRTVANHYINNHPEENLSIEEVMMDSAMFSDAYTDFNKEALSFAQENKRQAERDKKKLQRPPTVKAPLPLPTIVDINPQQVLRKGEGDYMTIVRSVGFTAAGQRIIARTADGKIVIKESSFDGDPEFTEFDENHLEYSYIRDEYDKKYGGGAFDSMIAQLKGSGGGGGKWAVFNRSR